MDRFRVALLAIVLLASPAWGAAKDDTYQQMVDLGSQIEASRGTPAFEALLAEYEGLSAQLGGDDPAGILGDRGSDANRAPLVAPAPPPGGSSTTTNFANNTPVAIVDNTTVTSDIVVAGVDAYLWDLDLTTDITHTFGADLDITLTSPGGTTAVISTDNGGGNDDVFSGTLWDDQANDPATDHTYANLTTATPLTVEEALCVFAGEDPNGTWTLSVADDAGGDTGTLNSWSLDVTTLTDPPVNTGPINFVNNTPVAIVDNTTVTSDIVTAALDTFLCDVDLTTDITHTFGADLDITLTSPGGTTTVISTDNGGGNDDVFSGTLWDDSANDPATDHTYANLTTATPLTVEEALCVFTGEDPNGTWTLSIADDAGGDTGTLNSWALDITTCVGVVAPPPPNPLEIPTLNSLGLAFLATLIGSGALLLLWRRRRS